MRRNIPSGGFWSGKRVFVTGHSGFKGGWLCVWLATLGAKVCGYSLPPKGDTALFNEAGIVDSVGKSVMGDILDLPFLEKTMLEFNPEIILHLAAQPLVMESYANPLATLATNAVGTANVLESARKCKSVRSIVCITTDKVYENDGGAFSFRETDQLGGHDPYSASKACSEIIAQSWAKSFLRPDGIRVSTARAGNVIGGGDWAENRIIPDLFRSVESKSPVLLRKPSAVRPWQHVVEPLAGYLLLAERTWKDPEFQGAYNFGPNHSDCLRVDGIATLFCNAWPDGPSWANHANAEFGHEADVLRLDCAKSSERLEWAPVWNAEKAVAMTVEWMRLFVELAGQSGEKRAQALQGIMQKQIIDYVGDVYDKQ